MRAITATSKLTPNRSQMTISNSTCYLWDTQSHNSDLSTLHKTPHNSDKTFADTCCSLHAALRYAAHGAGRRLDANWALPRFAPAESVPTPRLITPEHFCFCSVDVLGSVAFPFPLSCSTTGLPFVCFVPFTTKQLFEVAFCEILLL